MQPFQKYEELAWDGGSESGGKEVGVEARRVKGTVADWGSEKQWVICVSWALVVNLALCVPLQDISLPLNVDLASIS